MARGGSRKDGQDVLVKSAEFIGWALGGLEKEIAQTRDRLTALNAQALKLRTKIGRGESSSPESKEAAAVAARAASRRQRRSQMSPEARQRLSEMMKQRWVERRNTKS
jgi:hypothetical protein